MPNTPLGIPEITFFESYLWGLIDADTPEVLVPLSPRHFNTWQVIRIRVKDLHVPERNTREGKLVNEAVQQRLFRRWLRVCVTTFSKSFDRYVGNIILADLAVSYKDEVEKIMKEVGVEPGGM